MNVEMTKLANGLTVVSDPMPGLESTFAGVWVNTGGRNETRPVMGVSHMLEHMAFKGTGRRSARAIAEEIEAVGGYLNAYTSREQTAFHARILKADVGLGVDLLSDILTHPAFEQGELERERQVVLQELGQARDTPDDIIFDHLQAAVYPDQPMGWPILGEEDTVGNFTREQLRDYMGTNYRAGSMLLIASGAVNHAELVAMAEEKFSALPSGKAAEPRAALYGGGDVRVSEDLEQTHLTYGFPGVSSDDPDFYVAQAYVTALGGGMSSRLFQEVREKRGLCYSVYAFSQAAADSGMIGVYAGTGEKEAEEISAVIAGEMAALAANATDAEVSRAKAQMKSGLLMGLEKPATRAEQIASHLFTFGRVLSIAELTAKLDEIDAAAVRRFGARIMGTMNPAMAAIGPIGKFESHARFAKRFGGEAARRAAE
ncbi:MAG: insulinase family protein [Proteobacteria bacterium]|nr:insulinase family protein [Pseudomonadota bacterium]